MVIDMNDGMESNITLSEHFSFSLLLNVNVIAIVEKMFANGNGAHTVLNWFQEHNALLLLL